MWEQRKGEERNGVGESINIGVYVAIGSLGM